MSMTSVLLCHGFGLDPSFWDPLIPYLNDYEVFLWDLGYFGPPHLPQTPYTTTPQSWVGVGHSLGLRKVMEVGWPVKGFVGINGFWDFLGTCPVLRARRTRELETLTRHFQTNPQATLRSFYGRCGICPPQAFQRGTLNTQRCLEDLKLLATVGHPPAPVPVMLIGGADDPVVPRELLEDTMAHLPVHSKNRLHLLPQETAAHSLRDQKSQGPSHNVLAHWPEHVGQLLRGFVHECA